MDTVYAKETNQTRWDRCVYAHAFTLSYLLTLSIATGIKAFCLVLSTGYLYDWHVYRGKRDPLTGPNYMYRLIYDTLLAGDIWDNNNCVLFCDNAFTSIPLFTNLHDKRGIYAVGPINKSKPDKGGDKNSWPIQTFQQNDTRYLPRGWYRIAFSPLQRGGWLQALTWRDNRFVKLLSSIYITGDEVEVLRFVCYCVYSLCSMFDRQHRSSYYICVVYVCMSYQCVFMSFVAHDCVSYIFFQVGEGCRQEDSDPLFLGSGQVCG